MKEYYEEDQAAKAAQINETEQAMKQEASQGMYGKLKITSFGVSFNPKGKFNSMANTSKINGFRPS